MPFEDERSAMIKQRVEEGVKRQGVCLRDWKNRGLTNAANGYKEFWKSRIIMHNIQKWKSILYKCPL